MGRDNQGRWGLRLDPRTKLIVLVLINLALTIAVHPGYAHILVAAAVIFATVSGRPRTALIAAVAYILVAGAQILGERYLPAAAQLFVVTFFQIIGKVFPAGIIGAVIIQTTRVNEFVAALTRWRMPRVLITPFAVVFRYFPAMREQGRNLRDAMAIRGLSPTPLSLLLHPVDVTTRLYVPMLVGATVIADEIADAALVRGIDNPAPRTCLVDLAFGAADVVVILAFVGLCAGGMVR
ncbi:energy-coupling factor transporter transmembrane component T [Actinomyces israelii]|mgnify:FL=1|uniref:energy-coupling factor transporter transmembrane component T n=1 Tax=Actinomyces israelii TaxID=1659 RepID=UPI0025553F54|nr:energy-coupling factor transporter transmembrane component T [Actinomyces israelii]WKR20641.1 hypothetical protein AIF0345_0525 [Actinomyces israelii]